MHRKDLQALLRYLKENSAVFPLDVLRQQIVKAGHAPADADRIIAVFEGRQPPGPRPLWPAALAVALLNLGLACLGAELVSRWGAGKVACSWLVLLPGVYLVEFFAGLLLLASGKEREGRALVLGLLLFLLLGTLILLGLLARWLAKSAGS